MQQGYRLTSLNTSSCGDLQLVIQLAKAKGIHPVNLVRDRSNMEELEEQLKGLGGTLVTTESNLKDALGKCRETKLTCYPCCLIWLYTSVSCQCVTRLLV